MSVLLGISALILSLALTVLVLAFAVWLGASVYAEWRRIRRDQLNAKRGQTGWNYGAYTSPFPWHDEEADVNEEKESA